MVSVFQVPINTALPWQSYKITLSGIIFTLEFRYNGRMDRWIMNVNDASDNQILQGIAVLIERDLIGQYVSLSLPAGVFIATDNTGQQTQPGQNSFSIDHSLYYIDPSQ